MKNIKDDQTISDSGNAEIRAISRNKNWGSRHGMYMAAISALVIAIVIAFNLVIGSLPPGTLEYDISGKNIYTVTEQSVNYLKTLKKDVSIVVLAQSGIIDERVSKFINNYAKLSPHITLKIVDPVLDPTALTTYEAQENNVVISCAETGKTTLLKLGGIYGQDKGLILYDAESYYYSGQLNAVALDTEGQLTSAVSYVTSTTMNKMYLLRGHGEAALGSAAAAYISKANIETASLDILTQGTIPGDCQLILCNNPSKDLAGEELTSLETYLRTGGKMVLLLDQPGLGNYNALLAVYGLQMQTGYVGDNDRYYQSQAAENGVFCIYPVLSDASDVTSSITSNAILRFAHGMLQVTPERRAAVTLPFMTTSANGVLAVDEKNAVKGQYIFGATAVETFTDKADVTTRLTVITAVDLISDDEAQYTNLSNMDIFMNAVNLNFNGAQNVSIPPKTLNMTGVTIAHPLGWSVVFIGIIPLGVLGGGFVYWSRRRKR